MPSWNTSSDPKVDVDSFWACLQGRGECAFVKDPLIWGSNGRIFNRQYPYDGPFLVKKPHPSLKGFYKRDDPQVAQKQIQYMKDYGIDFFVYKWFFWKALLLSPGLRSPINNILSKRLADGFEAVGEGEGTWNRTFGSFHRVGEEIRVAGHQIL